MRLLCRPFFWEDRFRLDRKKGLWEPSKVHEWKLYGSWEKEFPSYNFLYWASLARSKNDNTQLSLQEMDNSSVLMFKRFSVLSYLPWLTFNYNHLSRWPPRCVFKYNKLIFSTEDVSNVFLLFKLLCFPAYIHWRRASSMTKLWDLSDYMSQHKPGRVWPTDLRN